MGWLADETGLEKNAANYVPLTPLSFLKRAADIHANRTAVVWKSTRLTYAAYAQQVTRLASACRAAASRRAMWWPPSCRTSRRRPSPISASPPQARS